MLSLSTLLALPLVAAVLGSALVSLVLCLYDLFRRRHSLPSLHFRESALNSRLLARCGLRQRVFSPTFWLTSPHVQTLLTACWPRGGDGQEVTFQREYLQMRDKGVVALDWVLSVQPRVKRKATVLLVLPPVTGDAHTVSSICELATKRGFRTVVYNRRGHGCSVLTTAKLLNAADPSDLRQVVKYLRLRFPKSRLAAVAYGTGCGLLISYLGEFGSSALLSAGTCVSPCYDTVEKFSGSLRSLYDFVHLLKLKWILLQHAKALSAVLDIKRALLKAWSFRAYEEAVYCRMYNYTSRSDSTSRGTHSTVSLNVNGVAASSSGGNPSSTISVGKNSNGEPRCSDGSDSGCVYHSSGAPNGNVVVEKSETGTVSSSASQCVSSSPLMSEPVSKASQASSRLVHQAQSSPVSNSKSHVTSSTLTQKGSHSVSEVLRQTSSPSETTSDTQTKSSLDSVTSAEGSRPTSECHQKSMTTSRLPQVPKEPLTSHSEWDSVFQTSITSPSQLTSSGSQSKSSSTSQLKSSSVSPPPPPLPLSAFPSTTIPPPSSSTAASSSPPTSHSPPPSPSSPPSPSLGALEEYWERNNPIRDVDDIAVPVLCINSLDDPFFTTSSSSSSSTSTIPYDLFRCYPNFLLVVTEKGGHCGFLERYPFRSWADLLCLDYLEAVFELTTRGYVTTTSTSTTATSSGSSSVSSSNSRRNTRSTI